MQRVGVIPTHVIQIISPSAEDETQEKSILTGKIILLILSFLSIPFRSIPIFAEHVHSVNINHNILRLMTLLIIFSCFIY